jgi:hypothetical protein
VLPPTHQTLEEEVEPLAHWQILSSDGDHGGVGWTNVALVDSLALCIVDEVLHGEKHETSQLQFNPILFNLPHRLAHQAIICMLS